MFGLIYVLWNTVMTIGSGSRAAINNQEKVNWWTEEKQKGNNPRNIYVDRCGIIRDLDTRKQISFSHLYRTGDIIRKEGSHIINISEKWRKERYEVMALLDKKHTVFPDIKIIHNHPNDIVTFEEHTWDNRWYAEGQWWKDYKTGNLYCVREIEGIFDNQRVNIEGYMNIDTGLFERISDDQTKKAIPINICNEILKSYNDKKNQEVPTTYFEWNKFYLNYKIAKSSGYFYLREILDEMKNDGCCPV